MSVIRIGYDLKEKQVVLQAFGLDNEILDVRPLTPAETELLEEEVGILLDATINLVVSKGALVEALDKIEGIDAVREWVSQQ